MLFTGALPVQGMERYEKVPSRREPSQGLVPGWSPKPPYSASTRPYWRS